MPPRDSSLLVRPARPGDAEPLVGVLTAAFFDDAPMRWAFPSVDRRREIVPAFFRLFFDLSVTAGGAFTTADLDAVVLGLPPDAAPPADFTARLGEVAGEYADALLTIVRLQEEHHPRHLGPHFYLAFGGVAPERQGHGSLGRVARHILDDCDRAGLAAYAEASSPGGEAVARGHGFAPIGGDIRIPGGPSLRPLWRPAGATR
ncbi:hypothetical protein [Gandjariella thermophila]|uniref:N-acetyltransferase domain-containing protein n=1 Tax=Gandjariella thermophila TaxID=1931992 RepID=A0A4D4J7N8_9PSEU|nr:hypothetical protein [Gandjariella thermophila]GDY30519.1 hypothetical protein GTS_21520 [Gandjariella thermophila]